jgi:hypothetical protein
MASRREIASDWQVAKSYVDRCVQRGCPTDSLEAARKWREENARRRGPTDQKSLARHVAEEKNDDSPEARARRKALVEDAPEGATLPSLPELPAGDPLEWARKNSQHVACEAWKLLEEAMLNPESKSSLAMLLAIHNKAIEALVKTETMIREELERRNVLISLTVAEDMARKGYHVMISRLTALPLNVGPRCNPHDPHRATEILQTEAIGIITDIQKQFLPAA